MPLSNLDRELVSLLRAIGDKPALYLGSPSFERLHGWILGFLHGRQDAADAEPDLLSKFSEWQRAHTGIDKEAHWTQFIRFYSLDDRAAFRMFFHDLEVFLNDISED